MTVAPPPPSDPPSPPTSPLAPPSLSASSGKAIGLSKGVKGNTAPRIVLNAVEGFGKTTFAAGADDAALLMAREETGYSMLLSKARVPDIPNAIIESWTDLLATIDEISDVKTLALDALGGFERLCHEYVCNTKFNGDWGEKGFLSFHKGFELAVVEWLKLLATLDRARERGITIILLSHSQIRPFRNPQGEDFDRYEADCHKKTWGVTHKWADAVLFGNFKEVVDDKGKGKGGTMRVIYTERCDAYDAKNRFGMPVYVQMPNVPNQMWATIRSHIYGGPNQ